MAAPQVVHILHHGFSLCDRSEQSGLPRDWPEGHHWCTASHHHLGEVATCPACLAVYEVHQAVLLAPYRTAPPRPPCQKCGGSGQVCNTCGEPGDRCRCPDEGLPTPEPCPACQPRTARSPHCEPRLLGSRRVRFVHFDLSVSRCHPRSHKDSPNREYTTEQVVAMELGKEE
jgi:hypothetical protein